MTRANVLRTVGNVDPLRIPHELRILEAQLKTCQPLAALEPALAGVTEHLDRLAEWWVGKQGMDPSAVAALG